MGGDKYSHQSLVSIGPGSLEIPGLRDAQGAFINGALFAYSSHMDSHTL